MTPIRKGSNPVKIPFAIKSNDRTFAAWANEVRNYCIQASARIPTANAGRGASGVKPPFWGTISRVPASDPAEYQVTFTEGFLTYQNAGASKSDLGVTGYISPKIKNSDGQWVDMEADKVPAIPLPAVVSYVYLRVKTTADGVPKFAPGDDGVPGITVVAFDKKKDSIHHVRPSPSGGEEEGDYYFLILETESNEATPTPAPRVKRRITGNRELPNQLVEIANIGGKREIYEGYLPGPDDKHQFRSLEQLKDGEYNEAPVMAPLANGEGEGDTIKFVGLGVNQPASGSAPQRPANFELGADKKVSQLLFTGVDGPISFGGAGGTLNFAGGLCTGGSGNGENPPELTGKNLNLEIEYLQYNNAGEVYGTPYTYVTLFWRNGLYVGTGNPNDAPDNLIEVKATWLVNAA